MDLEELKAKFAGRTVKFTGMFGNVDGRRGKCGACPGMESGSPSLTAPASSGTPKASPLSADAELSLTSAHHGAHCKNLTGENYLDNFDSAQRLYTAAELLGTAASYVYERTREGELRVVDLETAAKHKIRIRTDDLQGFIDSRTTTS